MLRVVSLTEGEKTAKSGSGPLSIAPASELPLITLGNPCPRWSYSKVGDAVPISSAGLPVKGKCVGTQRALSKAPALIQQPLSPSGANKGSSVNTVPIGSKSSDSASPKTDQSTFKNILLVAILPSGPELFERITSRATTAQD